MQLLVVLALGLMLTPSSSADVLPDGPHIYVEGSAELDVQPDRLVITVTIGALDHEVGRAKSDVDRKSVALIESCQSIGVEPANISSTSLAVRPSYRYEDDTRIFEGTRVERHIEINLSDLSRYSELMRAIIEAEIAEITNVHLFAASSAEVEDRALEAALADAKQRAQRLADAAGAKLGDVYSISEFQTRRDVWQLQSGRYTTSGVPSRHKASFARVAADSGEIFSPGLLKAYAEAYVVFKLKP
jgi:uncharacterized protein YggE